MEILLWNLLGLVIGLGIAWLAGRVSTTTDRLERKLDLLIKHAGLDLPKIALDEALALVQAGKKIEAIKVYRAYLGCDLLTAKTAVERLHVQ